MSGAKEGTVAFKGRHCFDCQIDRSQALLSYLPPRLNRVECWKDEEERGIVKEQVDDFY